MSEARDATAARLPDLLPPEEQARADVYAVLGRLFAAAPDRSLLEALARAPAMGVPTILDDEESAAGEFAAAWDRLRQASAVMEPEAADREYVDLFVGVGRSEINLHASHWIAGFMMDKPLVEVRATLASLGLARRERASVVEDHLAALFETMRLLVAGGEGRSPAPLADQHMVFERHIAPWVERCCVAIREHPIANYYRRVAELTGSFVALERDSFAIGIT